MKKIYESFMEIADDFTDGHSATHYQSEHTADECIPWQHGVKEFAEFLDSGGVRIIENPDIYKALWKEITSHKPKEFNECAKTPQQKEKRTEE